MMSCSGPFYGVFLLVRLHIYCDLDQDKSVTGDEWTNAHAPGPNDSLIFFSVMKGLL